MNLKQLDQLIAEIRRVSFADDKTSLSNALSLDQEEGLINDGTSQYKVIVFGDLNDFKHLNDIYGHEAGDAAINKVGETIHDIFIEDLQGKAFRQSGDEFVILLKEELVERFLLVAPTFGDIVFSYNENELRAAMSFGYVFNDGKTSFRDLLTRAEAACQYAKAKGDGTSVEWIKDMETHPHIRITGRCQKCAAKINCNMPKENAPAKLKFCPCCGDLLSE